MTTDFTIPNFADAAFPAQARLYNSDIDILAQAAGGEGNISGGAVTPSSLMTLSVSAGFAMIGSPPAQVTIGSGTVVVTTADATLDRIDLVVVNASGVKSVTAGTPGLPPIGDDPGTVVQPEVPASSVALAQVYVPATDTTIGSTQINGRRINVPPPPPATGALWATVSKATDQSKTTDTTLANDSALTFSMNANTKYRIRGLVFFDSTDNADFKYGFVGPASPTYVRCVRQHGTGSAPSFQTPDTSYPTPISIVLTTNYDSIVRFELIVHNGVNAGTFAFQWAQNTSHADTVTVSAGSYLEYAVA